MAQTKADIQALLAGAGMTPRHRFGQNFMIDQNLVRLIVEAGDVGRGDCVIEIGPGTGTLTDELLGRAGRVVAVEIDRNLAGLLRQKYAGNARFELIEGDALAGKHALNEALRRVIEGGKVAGLPVKLVANLPYNIASPLVVGLLKAGVEKLVFTVQKEVAQRLAAQAGGGEYGPLSVMVQLLGRVEILRTLPPQAFWPMPKIESALVRIVREDRIGEDAEPMRMLLGKLFSARRKTLRKALSQWGLPVDETLAQSRLDGGLRPERFFPEDYMNLLCTIKRLSAPADR